MSGLMEKLHLKKHQQPGAPLYPTTTATTTTSGLATTGLATSGSTLNTATVVDQPVQQTTHVAAPIVQETVRNDRVVEVQPIVHREVDQNVVHHIEKHYQERAPSMGGVVERAPIVQQEMHTNVINEIQPIIHRERVVPVLEHTETHLSQHIVQPTIHTHEVVYERGSFTGIPTATTLQQQQPIIGQTGYAQQQAGYIQQPGLVGQTTTTGLGGPSIGQAISNQVLGGQGQGILGQQGGLVGQPTMAQPTIGQAIAQQALGGQQQGLGGQSIGQSLAQQALGGQGQGLMGQQQGLNQGLMGQQGLMNQGLNQGLMGQQQPTIGQQLKQGLMGQQQQPFSSQPLSHQPLSSLPNQQGMSPLQQGIDKLGLGTSNLNQQQQPLMQEGLGMGVKPTFNPAQSNLPSTSAR